MEGTAFEPPAVPFGNDGKRAQYASLCNRRLADSQPIRDLALLSVTGRVDLPVFEPAHPVPGWPELPGPMVRRPVARGVELADSSRDFFRDPQRRGADVRVSRIAVLELPAGSFTPVRKSCGSMGAGGSPRLSRTVTRCPLQLAPGGVYARHRWLRGVHPQEQDP
jgi:hypothetical protein